MTKQNVLLALVVMLLSAHNATFILSGEKKLVGAVKKILGNESCACDSLKTPADTPSGSAAMDSVVYGLDISHWQGYELANPKSIPDSVRFIICKATEGLSYIDPDFQKNRSILDTSAFIRGNYHFYRCGDDPVKQAAFYVATVDSFPASGFPPIVDIEEPKKGFECGTKKAMDDLLIFLQETENMTGRTPMIYTNYDFGSKHLTNPEFARYPLWIADDNKTPRLIGAWKRWTIWQKSSHFTVSGIRTDLDVFNGSFEELRKFLMHSQVSG